MNDTSPRGIQIDLWGGDFHQSLVGEHVVATWPEAFAIIQSAVDAGLLANVLHQDFKANPQDADKAMRSLFSGGVL